VIQNPEYIRRMISMQRYAKKQLEEVVEFSKRSQKPGPGRVTVVGGDFNVKGKLTEKCTEETPEYREMVATLGMGESFMKELDFPATMNRDNFLLFEKFRVYDCLDHVFSDGEMSETQVLTDWNISDHYGIECRVAPQ